MVYVIPVEHPGPARKLLQTGMTYTVAECTVNKHLIIYYILITNFCALIIIYS